MKQSNFEVDERIEEFLNRKSQEFPEIDQIARSISRS